MEYLIILFLGLFVVLMVVSQLMPWYFARRAKGRDAQALQEIIHMDARRHMVYFWSPSCGHCRSMTTVINELMEQRDDVHAINLVDKADIAREIGVMGTPALAVIENGRIIDVQLGARTRSQILRLLED